MKQYYITSLYSQNLQVAVQQDHANTRMIRDSVQPENTDSEEYRVWDEYSRHHETTICLGVSQPTEILALYAFLSKHKDKLRIPFGIFQEASLNYTPTALSFITNERLSLPIAREVQSILKNNKIRSLYEIKEDVTLSNFFQNMLLIVHTENGKPKEFTVRYVQEHFKSAQSEELIPKDLSPEYLDKIYQDNFYDDFCFHNDIEAKNQKRKNVTDVTYSIEELVFMDLISQLRLK